MLGENTETQHHHTARAYRAHTLAYLQAHQIVSFEDDGMSLEATASFDTEELKALHEAMIETKQPLKSYVAKKRIFSVTMLNEALTTYLRNATTLQLGGIRPSAAGEEKLDSVVEKLLVAIPNLKIRYIVACTAGTDMRIQTNWFSCFPIARNLLSLEIDSFLVCGYRREARMEGLVFPLLSTLILTRCEDASLLSAVTAIISNAPRLAVLRLESRSSEVTELSAASLLDVLLSAPCTTLRELYLYYSCKESADALIDKVKQLMRKCANLQGLMLFPGDMDATGKVIQELRVFTRGRLRFQLLTFT